MYKISIYVNAGDKGWIKELKKYALDKRWSVSLTIREIVSGYFKKDINKAIIETTNQSKGYIEIDNEVPAARIKAMGKAQLEDEPTDKIDITTFEAQMENEIKPKDDVDDIIEAVRGCDRRIANKDGTYSCWFFDQGRSYHSYCVQYCWTRENLWGKRVRL